MTVLISNGLIRSVSRLFVSAALLSSYFVPVIHAIETSVMYGINDPIGNGTLPGDVPAKIVQVTMTKDGSSYSASFLEVFDTGMYGQANAFAYDTARDQMFFISSPTPGGSYSPRSLYDWNRGSSLSLLADSTQIGVSGNIPANAVYYSNAFWFFDENGTDELVKVNLNYSGQTPSFGSTSRYAITGYAGTTAYGDIAIDANTGMLYGASTTGLFFSLNVAGASPTGYTSIKASGNPSLQIAFSPDFSTLYGQDYSTGKWYTIDKLTGNTTDINVTSPTGLRLRDLGGSSFTQVPEPSTYALAAISILALAILAHRKRKPKPAMA